MKLESVRAGSGTKARNLLIKTTEREHSSSVWDFSPEESCQERSQQATGLHHKAMRRPEDRRILNIGQGK
jgi:hypothetical protein